jgi:glutaredoxin-related protein
MAERPLHPPTRATPRALAAQAHFHSEAVQAVASAVAAHDVVVVGMGWNPHVRRARAALDAAGVPHHDLDFGNYVTGWKTRLAIKLWAGWPTYPMVFVRGVLVGGASDTVAALGSGTLRELLDGSRDS